MSAMTKKRHHLIPATATKSPLLEGALAESPAADALDEERNHLAILEHDAECVELTFPHVHIKIIL